MFFQQASSQTWVLLQHQKSTKLLLKETYSCSSKSLPISPCGRNLGQKPPNFLQQYLFIRLQFYFLKDKEYPIITSSIRNFNSSPRKTHFLPCQGNSIETRNLRHFLQLRNVFVMKVNIDNPLEISLVVECCGLGRKIS